MIGVVADIFVLWNVAQFRRLRIALKRCWFTLIPLLLAVAFAGYFVGMWGHLFVFIVAIATADFWAVRFFVKRFFFIEELGTLEKKVKDRLSILKGTAEVVAAEKYVEFAAAVCMSLGTIYFFGFLAQLQRHPLREAIVLLLLLTIAGGGLVLWALWKTGGHKWPRIAWGTHIAMLIFAIALLYWQEPAEAAYDTYVPSNQCLAARIRGNLPDECKPPKLPKIPICKDAQRVKLTAIAREARIPLREDCWSGWIELPVQPGWTWTIDNGNESYTREVFNGEVVNMEGDEWKWRGQPGWSMFRLRGRGTTTVSIEPSA